LHIRARNLFLILAAFALVSVTLASGDPQVVVATSTTETATQYGNQGRVFKAASLYWVWYTDGTNLLVRTSSEGSSWNYPTMMRATCSNGTLFSVSYNGSRFAYALATSSGLMYRQGAPNSSGLISWDAVEQTVLINGSVQSPLVAFDSAGSPLIGYVLTTPYIVKSSSLNGQWTNASGFPYQLQTQAGKMLGISSLLNATFEIVYAKWSTGVWEMYSKRYNSTSFLAEKGIGNLHQNALGSLSVTNIDNETELVYAYPPTPNHEYIYYVHYTGSGNWVTESIQDLGTESTSNYDFSWNPSITKCGANLYVFWLDKAKGLNIKARINSVWKNSVSWFVASDIISDSLSLTPTDTSSGIGVIYTTVGWGAGSYNVKFVLANFSVPVAGFTVTNTSNGFPILNATYDIDVRTLQFYTLGNATVTGITTNPQRVSVSDVFVGFDFSVPTLTLNDVTGQVRVYWKLEEKTSGQNEQAPTQTNIPPILTTPVFGQLGTLGLYIIVFSVAIIAVGGIVASVSSHKRAPKPRGHSRAGRSPTGFSRRSRR
jgi:hypothetical protein